MLSPPNFAFLTGNKSNGSTGEVLPGGSVPVSGSRTTSGSGIVKIIKGVICLASGYNISFHATPGVGDVRINLNGTIYGIPVIPATNNHAGAVRINPNGIVKALQLIN
jgi:hypothetical protein